MNILQISNNFTINPLYNELFKRIEKKGVSQTVLAHTFRIIDASGYSYKLIQAPRNPSLLSRIQFNRKIRNLWETVLENILIQSDINLIHAHTLFSDGAIAYRAHKEFQIPYIVAVRNTDINVFFKYLFHLRKLGQEILINAEKIILISPAYLKLLNSYIPQKVFKRIESKIEVIPNGINDIWLKNRNDAPNRLSRPIRLVFSGSFDKNKNILRIVEAANQINPTQPIELKLIGLKPGQTGKYVNNIFEAARKTNVKIDILERMSHNELISVYRSSDIFIMPSHHETFGLVYVEALSQGLPIIYTRNEGFDGFFKEGEVGFPVDSYSCADISRGIEDVISNYSDLSERISKLDLTDFNWDSIANRYFKLYQDIVNNFKTI